MAQLGNGGGIEGVCRNLEHELGEEEHGRWGPCAVGTTTAR